MTQIAILTRTFDDVVGGVEKMVLALAEGLTEQGHKVTIISLDLLASKSYFEWPIAVDWEKLNLGNPNLKASFRIRARRVRAIRKILKLRNIKTVIGFQIGSFALVRFSSIGLGIHSVAAERNSPTLFNFIRFGRLKRIISQLILLSASKVTVQFENYRNLYPKLIQKRLLVTPNPVKMVYGFFPIWEREEMHDSTNIRLLYIGRFSYQKNVECLVSAFELLPERFSLTLLGPESHKFKSNFFNIKANPRIETRDEMINLNEVYFSHDIFCLASRFEGFPNVVGEALAHGLPVVGFEECSGMRELISPGINGEIACGNDDHVAFSKAILRASVKVYNRKIISESINRYTLENFLKSWTLAIEPK